MKLYWNEQYPESLYCLGPDSLYRLSEREHYNPMTGELETGEFSWTKTVWGYSELSLKRMGFEFIGEL